MTNSNEELRKLGYEMVDKYFESHGDPECLLISKKDFTNNPYVQALITQQTLEARIDEATWFKEKQEEIGMHDCCYSTAYRLEEATTERLAQLNKGQV